MQTIAPSPHWALIGLALLQFNADTRATTLGFDDTSPVEYVMIENGYGGLRWTNFFIQNAGNAGAFQNGLISTPNVAFNGLGNPASISSALPFDLVSAHVTATYNSTATLRAEGFAGAIRIYDRTYVLNNSTPALVTFDYAGVDQVRFSTMGNMIFAMDNLAIGPSETNSACAFEIAPHSRQHWPGAETGFISVATFLSKSDCMWSVVNTNSWVTITSIVGDTNLGSVTYTVASNLTGHSRSGVVSIAGHAFTVSQYAPAGTNTLNLGQVSSSVLGHRFSVPPPFSSLPNSVTDFLVDQDQSSGGGAQLPSVIADFDDYDQFVLKVSAPPGQKFVVRPPAGQSVRFFAGMNWQGNPPNGPSRYGSVSVHFGDLEGPAPSFSASRTVLSEHHGFFGFNDIRSTAFTDELAFSSITLVAKVPAVRIGSGEISYSPHLDGSLGLTYATSEFNDPGPFVILVPSNQPAGQPKVHLTLLPNGDLSVSFAGTLQISEEVNGSFQDAPGNPQGVYIIPKANLTVPRFFRSRND